MSDDLIKRSDAIETLKENVMFEFTEDEELAITCLRNLPSADRPQGEWIDQHENGHGFWVGTCNQCSKENRVNNYCPNCGARMKGADDD